MSVVFILVAVVGLLVLLAVRTIGRARQSRSLTQSADYNLRMRYSNGEMDHQEYDEQMLKLGACRD